MSATQSAVAGSQRVGGGGGGRYSQSLANDEHERRATSSWRAR